MAQSRDRLIRLDHPLTPIYSRTSIRSAEFWRDFVPQREFHLSPSRFSNANGQNLFRSQLPWRAAATISPVDPAMGPVRTWTSPGSVTGGVPYATPTVGIGRRRDLRRFRSGGQENLRTPGFSGRRRRRGTSTVLPSWYPRVPLQDITAVVNAIERRSRLGEAERSRLASPSFQELSIYDPSLSIAGAPLEHSISHTSPKPMFAAKTFSSPASRLSQIFRPDQTAGQSDFLTPQKKLLNSIDQVEKVVMEDFRRMKRTPAAKRAEREKKVHRLMAMR